MQTRLEGYISPEDAALTTADVANVAVPAVSRSRADWKGMGAVFCIQLTVEMNQVFRANYKSYGARVTQWLQ